MRHTLNLATSCSRLGLRFISRLDSSLLRTSNCCFRDFVTSQQTFNYEARARMSESASPDRDTRSNEEDHVNAEAEGNVTNSSQHKKSKGPPRKKDTHFICFPLVTETSIPQLAKSLHHFRQVSTKSGRDPKPQIRQNKQGSDSQDATNATLEPDSTPTAEADSENVDLNPNLNKSLPVSNPDLQILPGITHRPPGTFHLTLGVMDLSTKEEMDRALALLQDLDLARILSDVLATNDEVQDEHRWRDLPEASSQNSEQAGKSGQAASELSSLHKPVSPPPINREPHSSLPDFSKDKPPQIALTGLSTFPSAKSSRVFFAKPSPSPSSAFPLLLFGQEIRRRFREAGFITETRPLVLHATVANMRYATQARGGRTSKGKSWRYGKDRWKEGQLDARELIKCFNLYDGDVERYSKGDDPSDGQAQEFIWASDIVVDRVALCKMGAVKSDDDVLGMVYPPVGEKMIFS